MPDHLHFLIEGQTEHSDFRTAMRVLRKRTTVDYHRSASGPLWQDGYHERVLRDDESTLNVVNYIVANPVRAGLVENALDYPFSWSIEYSAPADQNSVRPAY